MVKWKPQINHIEYIYMLRALLTAVFFIKYYIYCKHCIIKKRFVTCNDNKKLMYITFFFKKKKQENKVLELYPQAGGLN